MMLSSTVIFKVWTFPFYDNISEPFVMIIPASIGRARIQKCASRKFDLVTKLQVIWNHPKKQFG